MPDSSIRSSAIPRLGLVLLALAPLLGGCVFVQFSVAVQPREGVVLPGDSVRVTVAAEPLEDQTSCDVLLCVDVTGQVFDYVVENLPPGVTYNIDTSLRSPSTPGVVHITFDAGAGATPGLYSVLIRPVVAGHSLGAGALTLRILPVSHAAATTAPVSIAARSTFGRSHSLVALGDGSVRAWGTNSEGQLGDGSQTDRTAPVTVGDLDGIVEVSAGHGHSLALITSGRLRAWGDNHEGELGDGTTISRIEPVPVQGIHNVRAIAAGGRHSLALRTDATVWAWGGNFAGQLGDGTEIPRSSPMPVSGLARIHAIAGGSAHSLALDFDGTVWAWGDNRLGQLGDGSATNRLTPQPVPGLGAIRAIAAGSHSLALAADGTVWAWGENFSGQLGDGTQVHRRLPVSVQGLTGIRAIAAGLDHSLALAADGTVWAWGSNTSGQLGDGVSEEFSTTPVRVRDLSGVQALVASQTHSMALLDCGQIWSWGGNGSGELGDGSRTDRPTPAPVPGIGDDRGCERVALRVSLVGEGHGTVAGSTGPLSCVGFECIAIVERGMPVALTATAGADSRFERWAAECQGEDPVTIVAMDSSKHCAAVFRSTASGPFLLTVLNGGGLVTSSGGGILGPDHIDCGETCHAVFQEASMVTVAAVNAGGFHFSGWASDCSGTAPETTVTMSGPRTCRANFQPFALSVSVTGSGLVTSTPAGIDCGQTCSFAPRTGTVTLTAAPEPGWQFDGWSGDCTGAMRQTSVVIDADKSCAASFSQIPGLFFTLTVTTTGNGRVTSSHGGIDCGADCAELYGDGTLVTLTATPDAGFRFDGWSEDCAGTDRDAQVTVNADRTCHASFSPDGGPFTLTITINEPPGSPGAIVGVQPPGNPINCRDAAGPVCAQAFAAGTVVVVRPSDSSLELGLFGNWLGCDTVDALFECAVLMTGNRTVTATFVR